MQSIGPHISWLYDIGYVASFTILMEFIAPHFSWLYYTIFLYTHTFKYSRFFYANGSPCRSIRHRPAGRRTGRSVKTSAPHESKAAGVVASCRILLELPSVSN